MHSIPVVGLIYVLFWLFLIVWSDSGALESWLVPIHFQAVTEPRDGLQESVTADILPLSVTKEKQDCLIASDTVR